MSMKRRQHSAQSKAMMALEAVKERRTVNELAADYGVHPTPISQWKRQLRRGCPNCSRAVVRSGLTRAKSCRRSCTRRSAA